MNERQLNRRQVLVGAAAIAALGALWTPPDALADDAPLDEPLGETTLTVDVACLGGSFAANFDEALDAAKGDLRGVGFFVEGYLYWGGTLPTGAGFDPASRTPRGHWLCRGWFMFYPDRPVPHVVTTQEYLFGMISDKRPSPAHQLVSSGVEGGVPTVIRSVIGGTGKYRHARGEVIQKVIGTNTTVLNVIGEQAPNFRFAFKL